MLMARQFRRHNRMLRATYMRDVSVALLLSVPESAAAPASPIRLFRRLQRGEEGQGCSWRDRAAGAEQGARDLLEQRQRRVALERLRERRGAHGADSNTIRQAAARRGGLGMLMIPGPPTQDTEHDSLEIRLPGLKQRDRFAHDSVRKQRDRLAHDSVRLFRLLPLCLALPKQGPKLVHFDLSPRHARLLPPLCSARRSSCLARATSRALPCRALSCCKPLLLFPRASALLGAEKLVSRARHVPRAPVPRPLLLQADCRATPPLVLAALLRCCWCWCPALPAAAAAAATLVFGWC